MAPVGSRVMRIAVRAIVITAWVIRRPVKDRNRDRYGQTEMEEDPGLRLGLSQQRESEDHRQYDNKFFYIVTSTDGKLDFRLRHAAKGAYQCRAVWAYPEGGIGRGNLDETKALMQCKAVSQRILITQQISNTVVVGTVITEPGERKLHGAGLTRELGPREEHQRILSMPKNI